MKVGIVGYGVYVPKYRIRKDQYVKAWGSFSPRGVDEKSLVGIDEDVITMAIESSSNALSRAEMQHDQLSGVFFASTSAPYAEKLSSSTIVSALNSSPEVFTADFGYSTKAGTTALLSCLDFISSRRGSCALISTSDAPLAMPGDPLEHALGAGSASFVVGKNRLILDMEGSHSYCMETMGERFRRQGRSYLRDSGISPYNRQAFSQAVVSSVNALLVELELKAEEFTYAIFQQFDGKGAYDVGKRIGFKETQIAPSMSVCKIGDTGCCSPLIGLCGVLDLAKQGDRILLASYGSGCGSDAMSLVVTDNITESRDRAPLMETYVSQKEYVDYITYLKYRRMLQTN